MKQETFIHPNENRESEVILSKGRLLGRGGIGEVHEVLVELGGHKKTMALKEFKDDYMDFYKRPGEKMDAEEAFEHYQKAQKAGLKVFKTYRLSKDRKSILMTNGHSQEIICLGTNNPKENIKEELEGERLKSIDNLDEFLNNLYEEISKAVKNNFIVTPDSLFFLIDRQTRTHLDFVFGDLDGLRKSDHNIGIDLHDSFKEATWTVISFIGFYTEKDVTLSYQQKVTEFLWSKFPEEYQ